MTSSGSVSYVVSAVLGRDSLNAGHERREAILAGLPRRLEGAGRERLRHVRRERCRLIPRDDRERQVAEGMRRCRVSHGCRGRRKVDHFQAGIGLKAGRWRRRKLDIGVPLLRPEELRQILLPGVDQHEPGDLARIGAGVEPGEEATERMGNEHVGPGEAGRGDERVQLLDDGLGRPRHGNGIAAALMIAVEDRARPIVGTDAGESGDALQHRRLFGVEIDAPDVGVVAVARHQDHGGVAGATALEIEAASADIDLAGVVARRIDDTRTSGGDADHCRQRQGTREAAKRSKHRPGLLEEFSESRAR